MTNVHCAQRMFNARNRRHLPECIRRLLGLDNAVDKKGFKEIVQQARKPKSDTPKAQLILARAPWLYAALPHSA